MAATSVPIEVPAQRSQEDALGRSPRTLDGVLSFSVGIPAAIGVVGHGEEGRRPCRQDAAAGSGIAVSYSALGRPETAQAGRGRIGPFMPLPPEGYEV